MFQPLNPFQLIEFALMGWKQRGEHRAGSDVPNMVSVQLSFSWGVLVSPAADRLGKLWTNGPQMLYGCSSNLTGGAGPQYDGDRLVQALPYLLNGGPKNGPSDPPFLPDVLGKYPWTVLWAILRLMHISHVVFAISIKYWDPFLYTL